MTHRELTFHELHITPSDLYMQMGYGSAIPDAAVQAEVSAVLTAATTVTRPSFCFFVTRARLDTRQATFTLPDTPTPFSVHPIIARQLRGSEAFALFLATAGTDYEQWRTSQHDLVRIYVADALGSLIAERSADRMEESLQASIDKLHWRHTNRFSPGYCGWHVSEQQHLLPLFGTPNPCGITLTGSSLMLPIKSVSGIIGLGSSVRHLDYACGLCDFPNCFRRKR